MKKNIKARENMIKGQIMPEGVNDPKILQIFSQINREDFIDDSFKDVAYCDQHLKLSDNRYLLSPVLLAKMVSYSSINKNSKVLDIYSGTGYSTCVISNLCEQVISIEPDKELSSKANKILKSNGVKNTILLNEPISNCVKQGDKFDAIFINGMINENPEQLYDLLSDNGEIIFVKKGKKSIGVITLIKKKGDNFDVIEKDYSDAPFLQDF